VNRSPTEEFNLGRGLRQRDPFAAFPFLIVVEGLTELVRQMIKFNKLAGIKVGRNKVEICTLQFADDTLFLCEDSFSNIFNIKAILRCYELASGLKINFHKSKLVGVNVERKSLGWFAKLLNYVVTKVPFIYFGLEVGENPRKGSSGSLLWAKSVQDSVRGKGGSCLWQEEYMFDQIGFHFFTPSFTYPVLKLQNSYTKESLPYKGGSCGLGERQYIHFLGKLRELV